MTEYLNGQVLRGGSQLHVKRAYWNFFIRIWLSRAYTSYISQRSKFRTREECPFPSLHTNIDEKVKIKALARFGYFKYWSIIRVSDKSRFTVIF